MTEPKPKGARITTGEFNFGIQALARLHTEISELLTQLLLEGADEHSPEVKKAMDSLVSKAREFAHNTEQLKYIRKL